MDPKQRIFFDQSEGGKLAYRPIRGPEIGSMDPLRTEWLTPCFIQLDSELFPRGEKLAPLLPDHSHLSTDSVTESDQ